jgi:hypothetical protein
MLSIVNWRNEWLLAAIAGTETCWIVAWSRVILERPGSSVPGLSWLSVWALFFVALITARTLGRLESPRVAWYVGAVALFTSLLFLWINRGATPVLLTRPADPSVASEALAVLFAFLVWFRALRIPGEVGDMRAIAREFQIGLLILVAAVLVSLGSPTRMNDLAIAYFGFGLLAVALTRVDEAGRSEPGGAAPMSLKWVVTLTMTLLVVVVITLLATQVITVEVTRWILRPVVTLVQIVLFVSIVLATEMALLFFPLLQRLIGDLSPEDLENGVQNLRQLMAPNPEEEAVETARISPQFVEALQVTIIVLLALVAVWLIARSFRRWRVARYTTPGGAREQVAAEGSLAEDLAGYLRDQWRRLRQADLRRLFQRMGTGSIRAIYANLLALMDALGHPRQPEQTPSEFEPVAGKVLPDCQLEIEEITEAFVHARYGETEVSAENLAHLKQAWERVRADGEELGRIMESSLGDSVR